MKYSRLTRQLFALFTRVLPPPLAYRLDFSMSERVYQKSNNMTGRSLYGSYSFDCDFTDIVQKNFFIHGSNAFYSMVLARQLVNENDIVFEIGANVGTETLSLSHMVGKVGKVIALEPSERNKEKLDQALDENSIENVITINAAVDIKPGKLSFKDGCEENSGIGYLEQEASQFSTDKLIDVVSLDSLKRYGSPKLIFMDIEGHEIRALQGAATILDESRPYIIFEFNTQLLARSGSSPNDLIAVLDKHGYQCFDIGEKLVPINRDFDANIDTDFIAVPNEYIGEVPRLRRRQYSARLIPRLFGFY